MNIWDYIHLDDAKQLTDEEFESFRNYLRILGYRIHETFGRGAAALDEGISLALDRDTDLYWYNTESLKIKGGKRIPLTEVKRMAQLGMIE